MQTFAENLFHLVATVWWFLSFLRKLWTFKQPLRYNTIDWWSESATRARDNEKCWHPFTASSEEEFLSQSGTRYHHKCSPAEATEPGRCAETEAGLLCSELAGCCWTRCHFTALYWIPGVSLLLLFPRCLKMDGTSLIKAIQGRWTGSWVTMHVGFSVDRLVGM